MIDPPLDALVLGTAPVLGALVGSFLNVCIYRLPREELSIVLPPSHCPRCGTTLAAWQNVPVVSWLLLAGKCHSCRSRISPMYPAIELLTAALFGLLAWAFVRGDLAFGPLAASDAGLAERLGVLVVGFWLTGSLLVATFVDLKFRIIPDEVTELAVFPAILASGLVPALHLPLPLDVFRDRHLAGLASGAFGAIVGGGSIHAVGIFGKRLLKKEAMGFGDVKLMAFLGAVLGWQGALLTFFVACVVGAVIGIFVKLLTGDRYTPFGPYLAVGAAASFLARDRILAFVLEELPARLFAGSPPY